jgi:hypothetical protein
LNILCVGVSDFDQEGVQIGRCLCPLGLSFTHSFIFADKKNREFLIYNFRF